MFLVSQRLGRGVDLDRTKSQIFKKKSFEGAPKAAQELQMLFLYTIYHIQKIGKTRQNYANICAIFCYGEKNAYFSANISPNFVFNISHLGTLSKEKNDIIWESFPTWGGVFPNPKTFVNLPSIFLYAKFILRC